MIFLETYHRLRGETDAMTAPSSIDPAIDSDPPRPPAGLNMPQASLPKSMIAW